MKKRFLLNCKAAHRRFGVNNPLLVLLIVFSLGSTPTNVSAQLFQKVLLSDQFFVSEKISFVVKPPELNDQGKVAFVAFMSPSSDYFLFIGSPGSLEVLARQRTSAGGVSGELYDSFDSDENKLTINPSGVVIFSGALKKNAVVTSANDNCLWYGTPGNVQLIGREDGPTPDLVGEFFGSSPFFSSDAIMNRSGNTAFRSTRKGTQPRNGVWSGAPADPKAIAMTGNSAPDVGTNYLDISRNALSQNGQIAFSASLNSSADKALFAGPTNSLHKVFRFGEPAHGLSNIFYGGGATDGITSQYFNDDLLAYVVRISGTGVNTTNDSALWAGTAAAPQLIVREGDLIPANLGGGNIAGFSTFNVNSNGNLLVLSQRQGNSADILLWSQTVSGMTNWIEVAREGATLAGLDISLSNLFTTLAFSLSDNGDVIFYGNVSGPGISTTNDVALLRWNAATRTVRRVVQEGDTIEVAPGDFRTVTTFEFSGGLGHSASQSCGVNGSGQVAFKVNFSDNTKGVMIANPPTNFAGWAYSVRLPSGKNGPGDDANGDGVPNIMVYYSGFGATNVLSQSNLVRWHRNGAAIDVEFDHDVSVTDVTAKIETAGTLNGLWSPGPALNVVGSNGNKATLGATINFSGEQGFARLVLSTP